jgi:hypothetical protein
MSHVFIDGKFFRIRIERVERVGVVVHVTLYRAAPEDYRTVLVGIEHKLLVRTGRPSNDPEMLVEAVRKALRETDNATRRLAGPVFYGSTDWFARDGEPQADIQDTAKRMAGVLVRACDEALDVDAEGLAISLGCSLETAVRALDVLSKRGFVAASPQSELTSSVRVPPARLLELEKWATIRVADGATSASDFAPLSSRLDALLVAVARSAELIRSDQERLLQCLEEVKQQAALNGATVADVGQMVEDLWLRASGEDLKTSMQRWKGKDLIGALADILGLAGAVGCGK